MLATMGSNIIDRLDHRFAGILVNPRQRNAGLPSEIDSIVDPKG